ncbi:phosphate transport system protein [Nocardioides daedukensis]|uniref:Phosphate-specific transport system accessory protein PhoU n=1 Tax=Nocardioides daedukensis TaxID=634462 RepID=A0A7Y9S286_9ACTN|nr:phosphate signaling complex protein PhoU [Nocardioides daedukensis]NYG59956.1 phosphate transport system protein [Nocardioides daedukensis]
MREAFVDELESVFADLAAIAGKVRIAVSGATESLLTGDVETAESVISADVEIDQAREHVEEKAFELLSLQQPVAGDLRTIVAALRMVAELERMGDLSVHVAKIARLRVPQRAVPEQAEPTIKKMAEIAEAMSGKVAEVIATRDVEAARDLVGDDEEMDALRRETFRQLFAQEWTHSIEAAVDLALLGRYYERIADHAVSVARRVVFVVTGEAER